MEFLVHIVVDLPAELEDRRADLIDTELARGRELIAQGHLKSIWRLPGRWANISLYEVRDATQLHELISSLPLWRWTTVDIEALADHPLTPAVKGDS